jgi:hypothetical protein
MEYAVRAETKEGDVVTLKRGFPSLSDAEVYPVRLCRWRASGWNRQQHLSSNSFQLHDRMLSFAIQTSSTAILPYPNFARALHLT